MLEQIDRPGKLAVRQNCSLEKFHSLRRQIGNPIAVRVELTGNRRPGGNSSRFFQRQTAALVIRIGIVVPNSAVEKVHSRTRDRAAICPLWPAFATVVGPDAHGIEQPERSPQRAHVLSYIDPTKIPVRRLPRHSTSNYRDKLRRSFSPDCKTPRRRNRRPCIRHSHSAVHRHAGVQAVELEVRVAPLRPIRLTTSRT